jgi:hypothetical protein
MSVHMCLDPEELPSRLAERQFFNHTGPLVDIDGPGSVFYMIRVREKSRQKSRQYQDKVKQRQNARNEHMHSIRLPQSLKCLFLLLTFVALSR